MNFIREANVVINITREDFKGYEQSIAISDLRVSFSILKSLAWSTNSAVIKIWNLGQANRNAINNFGDQVTIYAGYERGAGTGLLFIGDTTAVSHIYEQPEIITVLECGDGDKFINQTRVSVSYGPKTPARRIIQDMAAQMGIAISEFANSDNLIFEQPFNYIGIGKDGLQIIFDKLGLQGSVQNNALQIIPIQGAIVETPFQINEATGMQGIPQRFTSRTLYQYTAIDAPTTGYKVNTILNPQILPGSSIVLQSTHLDIKGLFRVDNTRHEGDTFGPIWSTNLQVTELSGNT